MKYLLSIVLLGILTIGNAQHDILKLASDVWPPFTDQTGNKAVAMEIVEEAMNRAEISVKTQIVDFTDVLTGLQSEAYDGSAALWKDNDRLRYLNFSEPYLQNRLILVGKKGSDVSYESLDAISNKRIAIVKDYAYGADLTSNPNLDLVEGLNEQQNLDRLMSGDVDYMLVDDLLIHHMMAFQGEDVERHLEIGEHVMIQRDLFFALRKNYPRSNKIVAAFNIEIQAMIKDGTYNRILELNWIRSDVDRDGHQELILAGNYAGTNAPSSSYSIMLGPNNPNKKMQTEKYYIDGVMYDDWKSVPGSYKLGQDGKDTAGMSVLKFNF